MKLIDKYVQRQILLSFGLCIVLFIFILLMGKLIRDGIELLLIAKANAFLLLKLVGLLILYVMVYALPLGLLSSILLVIGRMSSEQEITAFQSAGISIFRLSRCIFVLAFIGALFSLFINCYYAPYAKSLYKKKLAKGIVTTPLAYLQEKTFIKDIPNYIIYIDAKKNKTLENCWLWELNSQCEIINFIKAQRVLYSYEKEKGNLILTFNKGTAEKRDHFAYHNSHEGLIPFFTYDRLTVKIPLKKEIKVHRKLADLTLSELLALKNKEKEFPRKPQIELEIQKKIATSFSALVLTLIAIPLGIKASRKETYTNLILAFGLTILYYALTMIILWLAKAYHQFFITPLMWLPNILFASIGIYLWRKL